MTHVGHVIHGQNGLELCVQDAYGQESPYVHHGIEEWMLPEGSHHRNKDSTLFYLNRDKVPGALFDGKDENALNEEEKLDINKYFLYGVSFSKTMRSGDTERNARMEAVSLVSPSPLIELCRPFMEASLDLMMTPGKEAADHLDFATILSSVLMLAVVVANYSHTLSDNEYVIWFKGLFIIIDYWVYFLPFFVSLSVSLSLCICIHIFNSMFLISDDPFFAANCGISRRIIWMEIASFTNSVQRIP